MFINYRGTNVHALPFVTMKSVTLKNKKTGKKRTIQRVDSSQSPQEIKWLRPGWNEFPSHVWEQNKENPGVKKMIKDKIIVLMAEEASVLVKGKNGKKKRISKIIGQDDTEVRLKHFAEARAIEITKETLDRDILQRWLDEETRHKVKRALVKQIQPLLNPGTEEKEED